MSLPILQSAAVQVAARYQRLHQQLPPVATPAAMQGSPAQLLPGAHHAQVGEPVAVHGEARVADAPYQDSYPSSCSTIEIGCIKPKHNTYTSNQCTDRSTEE